MISKRIAYLILAHTDPTHLARMCRALGDEADIFVHVDLKSDIAPFVAAGIPPSVCLLADRVRVSWAGFSVVEATLRLITAALDSGCDYGHLVLLSGLDYPLRPADRIRSFLAEEPEREHIRFIDMTHSPEHYLNHVRLRWFQDALLPAPLLDRALRKALTLIMRPFPRRLPTGLRPCFGSQWWALTPDCAAYIRRFIVERPDIVSYYRHTLAPDEHLVHTIVGNSPLLERSSGFEPYTGRGTYKLANLHVIDPSLTKVYDEVDFNELSRSEKLFVRKVTTAQSSLLLDRIDAELRC